MATKSSKDTTRSGNPLMSKNIPPPPAARPSTQPAEEENGKTSSGQHDTRGTEHTRMTPELTEPEEERATVEISLYIRPSQDDKLEDLRREYKRRTRKKISANQLMRRLIDKATLEMLLDE